MYTPKCGRGQEQKEKKYEKRNKIQINSFKLDWPFNPFTDQTLQVRTFFLLYIDLDYTDSDRLFFIFQTI